MLTKSGHTCRLGLQDKPCATARVINLLQGAVRAICMFSYRAANQTFAAELFCDWLVVAVSRFRYLDSIQAPAGPSIKLLLVIYMPSVRSIHQT